MDQRAMIVIAFLILAVVLGYVGLEWSATAGHWNDAGDNWSR